MMCKTYWTNNWQDWRKRIHRWHCIRIDLPPGVAKFKLGGGHGGHNGLKDIISKLGNNPNFHRLRIGIGHPGDKNKVVGFVLGKPPVSEQKLIDEAIDEAARCTEMWFTDGLTKATNRLHAFKAQ